MRPRHDIQTIRGFGHELSRRIQEMVLVPFLERGGAQKLMAIQADEAEIKERFYAPLEVWYGGAARDDEHRPASNECARHSLGDTGVCQRDLCRRERRYGGGRGNCMDCRNHSYEFAKAAACVVAANGIRVSFDRLRPLPSSLSRSVHTIAKRGSISRPATIPKSIMDIRCIGKMARSFPPSAPKLSPGS